MIKMIRAFKYGWFLMALVCLIGLGTLSIAGCAGRTRTTTVTTQTTTENPGGGRTSSVTTDREVKTSAHPHGVIGGIFYTIGQVLIWPFKVIGSLF